MRGQPIGLAILSLNERWSAGSSHEQTCFDEKDRLDIDRLNKLISLPSSLLLTKGCSRNFKMVSNDGGQTRLNHG